MLSALANTLPFSLFQVSVTKHNPALDVVNAVDLETMRKLASISDCGRQITVDEMITQDQLRLFIAGNNARGGQILNRYSHA